MKNIFFNKKNNSGNAEDIVLITGSFYLAGEVLRIN